MTANAPTSSTICVASWHASSRLPPSSSLVLLLNWETYSSISILRP